MQTNKLFLTTLAFTSLVGLGVSGCTLQEATDASSPAPAASGVPAAQSAPAGGSPDGGGTTGSAAAPANSAAPPQVAEAHGPGDGHNHEAGDHGGGQGPTTGAQAPAGGGGMMAPMLGMGNPTAPLTPTPELDKKISDLEKSGEKKALAVAYATRGTARMNDEAAGPRVKYRAALDDYRKALAADPKNAEAARNKKQIEDIYKTMGRPVPGA